MTEAVQNLMAYRNRRERALLLELLEMTERVPVKGLAVCMITATNEVIDCTGNFAQNGSDRLMASLRLSRHLNEQASV